MRLVISVTLSLMESQKSCLNYFIRLYIFWLGYLFHQVCSNMGFLYCSNQYSSFSKVKTKFFVDIFLFALRSFHYKMGELLKRHCSIISFRIGEGQTLLLIYCPFKDHKVIKIYKRYKIWRHIIKKCLTICFIAP